MPFDSSIVGRAGEPSTFVYGFRDAVLYALGVGAKREELDYLYEGRGPKVLPGFVVVAKVGPMTERATATGGDMTKVVHVSEHAVLHAPYAPSGRLVTTATVRGIYDLGRSGSAIIDTSTTDASGSLVATTSSTVLFRGEGGFGGAPAPAPPDGPEVPRDRPADFRIEEKTSLEQALLYRLSGDLNPLHADPAVAAAAGFPQAPILHGLCTVGYMLRHAARGGAAGDATRITSYSCGFRKPVWPGETIVTEGWRVRGGDASGETREKIALAVSVAERAEAVLASAWVELGPPR